jgi:hypothetical protein
MKLVSASATSMTFSWVRPDAHGVVISHYNVDWGTGAILATVGGGTSFTLNDLKPDTAYSVKVQVRSTGNLHFFSTLYASSIHISVFTYLSVSFFRR